jgi:hypothetical protein
VLGSGDILHGVTHEMNDGTKSLAVGVERRLARVKACRERMRAISCGRPQPSGHTAEERRGSMSKLALSGLALGAAMAVGAAHAEPLTLSADKMDQVTAAGNGTANFDATLNTDINVNKQENIQKQVEKFQDVFVFGYFGQADGFANCSDGGAFGCQAVTGGYVDVVTETGTVTSVTQAEAAASGPFNAVGGGTAQ